MRFGTCGTCGATKTLEVLEAKGHVQTNPIIINAATCISQEERIYECTACGEQVSTLITKDPETGASTARLNHNLDANNKCQTCGTTFKAIDLGLTLGKEWTNMDIYHLYTMVDSKTNSSSKIFTVKDIPIGSIIKIAEGYDAKIDGWNVYREGTNTNHVTRRCDVSTFGARNFWATKGAWSTQLDPTLGTRYPEFFFTVKREDGAELTADDLTKALVVLVPDVAGTDYHAHSYVVTYKAPVSCVEGAALELVCECGEKKTEAIKNGELGNHVRKEGDTTDFACQLCGKTIEFPIINRYNNDIGYFSPVLPEKFKNAIHFNVADTTSILGTDFVWYDEVGNTIDSTNPMPHAHAYIGNAKGKMEFVIEVPEDGVYELAIHLRLKDNNERAAKFIVNEGNENKQSVNFAYKLGAAGGTAEWTVLRDQDITKSTYTYGAIKLNLTAGTNTLKITYGDGSTSAMHFRDFYLVKVGEYTPKHAHAWSEEKTAAPTCTTAGKNYVECACGATKTIKTIAALGHTKSELIMSEDPNCVSQRANYYKCTVCDETIVELDANGENARKNHSLDNENKCTVCGVQFKAIDLGFTLGKEWVNNDIYHLFTMVDSEKTSSTKVFTTKDIPIGSIIKVAAGYDAKIDGWDQFRTGTVTNKVTRRCNVSSFAVRPYWNDGGKDFTTQLDPTLGTRYGDFFFTIKRDDGAALTADDLAKALVILVPAN